MEYQQNLQCLDERLPPLMEAASFDAGRVTHVRNFITNEIAKATIRHDLYHDTLASVKTHIGEAMMAEAMDGLPNVQVQRVRLLKLAARLPHANVCALTHVEVRVCV